MPAKVIFFLRNGFSNYSSFLATLYQLFSPFYGHFTTLSIFLIWIFELRSVFSINVLRTLARFSRCTVRKNNLTTSKVPQLHLFKNLLRSQYISRVSLLRTSRTQQELSPCFQGGRRECYFLPLFCWISVAEGDFEKRVSAFSVVGFQGWNAFFKIVSVRACARPSVRPSRSP